MMLFFMGDDFSPMGVHTAPYRYSFLVLDDAFGQVGFGNWTTF